MRLRTLALATLAIAAGSASAQMLGDQETVFLIAHGERDDIRVNAVEPLNRGLQQRPITDELEELLRI